MSSQWVTAGFGLAGTVVGGLITLGANVLNNYAARTKAAIDRQTLLVDRGYEAQLAYAQAAQVLLDRTRELWVALAAVEDVQDSRSRYVEAWRSYLPARANSQLSVPFAIKPQYEAYNQSIIALVQVADDYFSESVNMASPLTEHGLDLLNRNMDLRFDAAEAAKTVFIEAARSHFSGD